MRESKAVSASEVSRHLDVSREQLRRLEAQGVIAKLADGGYDMDDTRIRYIRHLRDRPNRGAARDRLIAAQTKLNEQRLAEREHRLIPLEEFHSGWAFCFGVIVSTLAGVAARCTRDVEMRRTIDAEICEARRQAANEFERQAAALETTGKAA